ncbi:phosphatidylinositol N-acetylglucosaminyltransferase subunit H isoform X2 [Phyllopteryx taeniolatus]|uniref:phosphatidylinositol N-acetylglucosaminyltransferase subunit H isoform X2 n=1 Tax=Phyllopteryx taeniolatus TaxID=161469 RepID=UPI002AD40F12|nr:phosphatidylinositol N-acetylglucosaminyltransferase subunit H isoform X2 [Phyllopteryx taeniolatus]
MEDEVYTDINGKSITLECQKHCSFCREFTVSTPKVSIGKVMAYTCSVWLVAYTVFFFTENTAVLTGAILLTLVGMMLHIHLVKVDHESVLIIGSVGIQVSSSYASGRETSTFIEMSQVKDVAINETIYMDPSAPDDVSRVVPLFQSSKPRLNCLVKVYRSCQEILS